MGRAVSDGVSGDVGAAPRGVLPGGVLPGGVAPGAGRRDPVRSGPEPREAHRRPAGPLAVAAGAAVAVVALVVRDPSHTFWGGCPLQLTTGLYCPGCGALRATARLAHGDVVGALHENALWTAAVPVLVVWWVVWLVRARTGRPAPVPGTRLVVAGGVVAVLFAVARNLPWFAVLAPH